MSSPRLYYMQERRAQSAEVISPLVAEDPFALMLYLHALLCTVLRAIQRDRRHAHDIPYRIVYSIMILSFAVSLFSFECPIQVHPQSLFILTHELLLLS